MAGRRVISASRPRMHADAQPTGKAPPPAAGGLKSSGGCGQVATVCLSLTALLWFCLCFRRSLPRSHSHTMQRLWMWFPALCSHHRCAPVGWATPGSAVDHALRSQDAAA